MINASWEVGGGSNNLADSVGLMVYEGTQSLQYVDNYAHGSTQWEGFPIEVDVPKPEILLGCKETVFRFRQINLNWRLVTILIHERGNITCSATSTIQYFGVGNHFPVLY